MSDVDAGPSDAGRRALLRAAAWATPVITLTTLVPVAAATGEETDVGDYLVSSAFITEEGIAIGGGRVMACWDNGPQFPAQPFTLTWVISYGGSGAFTFEGSQLVAGSPGAMTVTPTTLTIVMAVDLACAVPAAAQFQIAFADDAGIPEPDSIVVSGSGVSADGTLVIPGIAIDPDGGTGSLVGPAGG